MKHFDYLELQILEDYIEVFKNYNIRIDGESLNSIKQKAVNKEYVVSVIGTMKAGKSTFINSVLGNDLMPSENAACTLTTTEIINDKKESSLVKLYECGQIEEISSKNISDDFHNEIRRSREEKESEKFKYVLRENIEAIEEDSLDIEFRLVDTPGYNEMSGLGVDRKIIEEVFKKQIKKTDYVIYVLDYKYYKAEENIEILEKIKLFREDIFENNNIMFVLNKIDLISYKDGSISEVIEEVKKLLEKVGVNNPAILPFSAKKAFFYKLLEREKSIEKYEKELDNLNKPVEKVINGQVHMVKLPLEGLKESLYAESNIKIFEENVLKELYKQRESLLIESLNGQKNIVIKKFLKNSREEIETLVNECLLEKDVLSKERGQKEDLIKELEKITEIIEVIEERLEIESKKVLKEKFLYKSHYVDSDYVYPRCEYEEYYSSSYSAEQNGKVKFNNWKITIKPNFLEIYKHYHNILHSKNKESICNSLKVFIEEKLESLEGTCRVLEKMTGRAININKKIKVEPKSLMNLSHNNSTEFLEGGYDNSQFIESDTDEELVEGFFGERWKTVYVYDIQKAMDEEEADILKGMNRCSELFFEDFYKKYGEFKIHLGEIVGEELEKISIYLDKIDENDLYREQVGRYDEKDEENIVLMGTIYNKLEEYLGGEK